MEDMQEHLSISMKELKKAVSIFYLSSCTSQFLQFGMRSVHSTDAESWKSIFTLLCCHSRPKLHLLAQIFIVLVFAIGKISQSSKMRLLSRSKGEYCQTAWLAVEIFIYIKYSYTNAFTSPILT